MSTTQTVMQEARAEGERLAELATQKADRRDPSFSDLACEFIEQYLRARQYPVSSEIITNACKAAGIVPKDDRAFGGVYLRLSRKGVIQFAGHCERFKGHGTSGGRLWELTPTWRGERG